MNSDEGTRKLKSMLIVVKRKRTEVFHEHEEKSATFPFPPKSTSKSCLLSAQKTLDSNSSEGEKENGRKNRN